MRLPLAVLLTVPATLAALDACVRAALWVQARRARRMDRQTVGEQPRTEAPHMLIVIPARAEGARLEATLASVRGREVLLLLDGAAPEAEARALAQGARVVVKTPAGPSKAAALAWLAREHRALLESFDAVMIIDAGSRFGPSFFEHFRWPGDAAAAQTVLRGSSAGVGAAAAESERVAQSNEDRGREALGWNVRLRGTGTAFRSATFLELMPRLDTRVEDLEATLLLTADGAAIRMTADEAAIFDEKPEALQDAASQRARWLAGRYELLVRRAPAFGRMIVRRPLEGLAFLVEIFGRPLSLTALVRLGAAAVLVRRGSVAYGAALASTVASDVALHAVAHRRSPGAVLQLAGSWLLALLLAPRAFVRWMKP
jgi:cellulose synthase/poly-beta-1,6-N-acetylglucosamine synthase-like glycosyltransferase